MTLQTLKFFSTLHYRQALVILTLLTAPAIPSSAQPGAGPIGPGPGCNPFPEAASGTPPFSLSYFGPSPLQTNPSFAGPVQLLTSGAVDAANGTITLPLYKGFLKAASGGAMQTVWYVLTEASDPAVASYMGINYSPRLSLAAALARTANLDAGGALVFDQGAVDFTPPRVVTPGSPAAFPPQTAQPGAVGDANYSPLVRVLNAGGVIYNAPMIAFNAAAGDIAFPDGQVDYTRVHDQVVRIDPAAGTVTLNLINGFSNGRAVWYLSLDASTTLSAAVEGVTLAPSLQQLPVGGPETLGSSAALLLAAVNGVSEGGCDNPQRQGLTAALTDGHRPGNILAGIPTMTSDYSPLWLALPYEWTADAVAKGYRGQMREQFQVLNLVKDGLITGPGASVFGTGSFIVNCPVAVRLN